MKSEIEKNVPFATVEFIESGGGVFEVEKDVVLIYSKKETGRFPEHQEVIFQLK